MRYHACTSMSPVSPNRVEAQVVVPHISTPMRLSTTLPARCFLLCVMRIETTRHTPLAGSGLVAPPPKPDRHVSAHPAFPPRLPLQTLRRSAGRSPEVPRTAGATPPSGPYPQSSL